MPTMMTDEEGASTSQQVEVNDGNNYDDEDAANYDDAAEEEDDNDLDPYDYEPVYITHNQEDSNDRFSSSWQRRPAVHVDTSRHDLSYHPGRVYLYSPARQRQQWGDTQILPRVNWGDLFFDLFYVAATYNVSSIMVAAPSRRGLVYAAGTFLPVMAIWIEKVLYDARFVHEDDVLHRLFQLTQVMLLATSILHIRSVDVMSNIGADRSVFVFALCLALERFCNIFKYLEIYFWGIGQPCLKGVALRDIKFQSIAMAFYVAAVTVAAQRHWNSNGDSSSIVEPYPNVTTATADDDHHRWMAAEAATANDTSHSDGYSSSTPYTTLEVTTDTPIYLCLFGYVTTTILFAAKVMFWFPNDGSHKSFTIPLNVSFIIHRNGEWIMLMLGESIFSLLIIDTPEHDTDLFWATLFTGLLTIVCLQYLHFLSQPHAAEQHALRRSKNAGICWSTTQSAYSLALVVLGSAYTFFLTDYDGAADDDGTHRLLASTESAYSAADTRQRAAHLFSGALAICFACLDAINLYHVGWVEGTKRCVCPKTQRRNNTGIALVVLRTCIIAFTATLSQWTADQVVLSSLGLLAVLLQLALRQLGNVFLSAAQVHVLHPQPEAGDDGSGDKHGTKGSS